MAATDAAVQQARTQMQQGDLNGALHTLDAYLKDSPQNAEARFTRGLVLAKLHRDKEAIKAFSDLTRDYPQFPEPYNNLAVLYAQQGQYEKARDALEAALATHPSYATASENLGDIYAALAGAAYNRALSLDKNNQQVRYKLSLINQLNQGPAALGATGTAVAQAQPVAVPKAPAAAPAGPPAAVAAPPQQSAATSVPKPVASTAPPAKATPPAKPAPTADAAAARDKAAEEAVYAWANAWAAQDVPKYLSFYAAGFRTPDSSSHAAWVKERRERLKAPDHISVQLSDMKLTPVDQHHVRATFKQNYRSNTFSDSVSKTLELSDVSGAWKIVSEAVN